MLSSPHPVFCCRFGDGEAQRRLVPRAAACFRELGGEDLGRLPAGVFTGLLREEGLRCGCEDEVFRAARR